MRVLVSYYKDCGRAGSVSGMFVCEKEDLSKIADKNIHFGEILGKHSDVRLRLSLEDFEIHTDDQEFISRLAGYVGGESISGYNPFYFLSEEE